MVEHFLQNKPYIEVFWDTLPHNVLCQISAPQKKIFVCTSAGIFYCSDDCMTVRKQYFTEQHMTEPSSFAVTE